ncbi:chemotaxis protein CheX [Hydrogenimonas sp.]
MIDLFRTSLEEVFSQTFGLRPEPCDTPPKEKGYAAQIPFSDGERDYVARVWVEEPALKKMADILLFDDDPDQETLEDLTSELANFIVGHAKMVASDRNLPYRMQTPTFVGTEPLESGGTSLLYKIDGRCIAVEVKENHG